MNKTLGFVFGFGMVMLSSSAAFAVCTPGNNGNGCSWSCSGNTMLVLCQNTAVTGEVPRCFTGDTDSGPLSEAPCTGAHGSAVAPPVKPNSAQVTKSEAVRQVMNLGPDGKPKTTAPAPTETEKLKGQKQGETKK